jgi:hypothetical protein
VIHGSVYILCYFFLKFLFLRIWNRRWNGLQGKCVICEKSFRGELKTRSGRVIKINKKINCRTSNVVYAVHCKKCKLFSSVYTLLLSVTHFNKQWFTGLSIYCVIFSWNFYSCISEIVDGMVFWIKMYWNRLHNKHDQMLWRLVVFFLYL